MTAKRRALIATTTAIATAIAGTHIANAEPALGTGVELVGSMDQTIAVDTHVNLADSRERGIPMLKKLRGEMWDLNVPFVVPGVSGSTLQQVAAHYGITTKSAYMNAVYSDPHLVAIAVQRAVEESVPRGQMNHKRPTNLKCGSDCEGIYSATFNGTRMWSENLAWHYADVGIDGMIYDQWGYGELGDLKKANGVWNSDNGHLHTQLNPKNTAFGFGYVDAQEPTKSFKYTGATAVSAYETTRRTDSLADNDQLLTFYRLATDSETPTGPKTYELRVGETLPYAHTATLWGGDQYNDDWVAREGQENTTQEVVFYGRLPGGSWTTETVSVKVNQSFEKEVNLRYGTGKTVREGKTLVLKAQRDTQFPEGTTFKTEMDGVAVDEATGDLTINAQEINETTKKVASSITVNFPNGTTATVPFEFTILNKQSEESPFKAPSKQVEILEGQDFTIDLSESIEALPKGAELIPSQGTIDGDSWYLTAPQVDEEQKVVPFSLDVRYDDESTGKGTVNVTVKNSRSEMFFPKYNWPETALEGTTLSFELLNPDEMPEDATYTARIGDVQGEVQGDTFILKAPEVESDSRIPMVIRVTYSDGTAMEEEVTLKVLNRMSDTYDPQYPEVIEILELTTKDVDFTDLVESLPVGTVLSSNDGLEFDSNTNILHLKADKDIDRSFEDSLSLNVAYPDGTKDTVNYVVRYLNRLSDENDPKFTEKTEVVERQAVRIDLVEGTDLPEGTVISADNGVTVDGRTISWVAPSVDAEKTEQINVKFTYSDGSVDTQTIAVTVKNSLADEFEPNTEQVDVPEVREGAVAEIDLTSVLVSLPDGTQLIPSEGELVEGALKITTGSVDSDTRVTVPVSVNYTDGSKDSFDVAIDVKNSIADTFTPQYTEDTRVEENSTATFTAGELPAGTTARLVNEVPGVSVNSTTGEITYQVGELEGSRTERVVVEFKFADGSTKQHALNVALDDVTPPVIDDPEPEDEGSSTGEIIGIVVAVLAVIGAIAGALSGFMNGSFSIRFR